MNQEIAKQRFEDSLLQELTDAHELLAFAVSEGRVVEDDIFLVIKDAAWLGLVEGRLETVERARFEQAYAKLTKALTPVTIRTVRATANTSSSAARRWSQTLWMITISACAVVFVVETVGRILMDDDQTQAMFGAWRDAVELAYLWAQGLVPFGYGTIGACAYLLRSCHEYIHDRTFDPLYKPEYLSRILLGAVSGGMILLFTEWLVSDDGTPGLSGPALAFLAGYNNDMLFTLVERIRDAVLPKPKTAEPPAANS